MTSEIPGLQRLGPAVLLQGRALRTAMTLMAYATRELRAAGKPLPPLAEEVATATYLTTVEQAERHDDLPSLPASGQWLTTDEVADRLGVSKRQAQRLARTLDATKERNGRIRYPATAVNLYAVQRQDGMIR